MSSSSFGAEELQRIYQQRFQKNQAYRHKVWKVLTAEFFQKFVPGEASVLDLGCGYGEFINHIQGAVKYGMDLNAESARHLSPGVRLLRQNCTDRWDLPDAGLDVVFTSNFFEHLLNKEALSLVLKEAHRCLKPGGSMICMGPNIKFLPGSYWDFWDHHLPLTELSLKEGLETHGFRVDVCIPRFLPYTMVNARAYPVFFVSLYLRLPWFWNVLGKQFLIKAEKATAAAKT